MCNIKSILLTYKNEYRLEYQYFAEFFRLLGVYVCENFENKDGIRDIEGKDNLFSVCYEVTEKLDFGSSLESTESRKNCLRNIIKIITKENHVEGWLEKLIDLFEEYQLLQASVTLQYFRMPHRDLVLEAGNKFEHAADILVDLVKGNLNYQNNKHIRYAKLYCKQKVNLARYLYDESYIYYINNLAIEGADILNMCPDFSNVWVLLGLIYENSKSYTRDSREAYDRGLNEIKEMPYASSVYYWKGRLCERNSTLKQDSDNAYCEAYNLVKKYRIVYKYARVFYDKKEWKTALEYFEECRQRIKQKGDYLDPLEQEYYFKLCVQMSSVYLKLEEYQNVIVEAIEAINFRENIIDGRENTNKYTEFYRNMYGEEASKGFIDLTIAKMGLINIYQNLAIACKKIGLDEEGDKYWQLYREEL